jgi:hypothetical protein
MRLLLFSLLPGIFNVVWKIVKKVSSGLLTGYILYMFCASVWRSDDIVEFRQKWYTLDTPPEEIMIDLAKQIPGMIEEIKPEFEHLTDSLINEAAKKL